MIYKLPLTHIQSFNIATQLVFDTLLIRYASINALVYLILSSFLAGSLHPCAAHFIAEHYVLGNKQPTSSQDRNFAVPETFSYYGPLNRLTYNVGLHNEHHDFPAIPWTRLPALHQIASEFYDDLPSHRSWVMVIWQFIWDKEVGLWCRVKRKGGGRKVGGQWREEELGFNNKRWWSGAISGDALFLMRLRNSKTIVRCFAAGRIRFRVSWWCYSWVRITDILE